MKYEGELSPCPFCGTAERSRIRSRSGSHLGEWSVTCCGCGAEGGWAESQNAAARKWNSRAPLRARAEAGGREARGCDTDPKAQEGINRYAPADEIFAELGGSVLPLATSATGEADEPVIAVVIIDSVEWPWPSGNVPNGRLPIMPKALTVRGYDYGETDPDQVYPATERIRFVREEDANNMRETKRMFEGERDDTTERRVVYGIAWEEDGTVRSIAAWREGDRRWGDWEPGAAGHSFYRSSRSVTIREQNDEERAKSIIAECECLAKSRYEGRAWETPEDRARRERDEADEVMDVFYEQLAQHEREGANDAKDS